MTKPPKPPQSIDEQCTGKTQHATREAANEFIKAQKKRGRRGNYSVYPCQHGPHYHVGHGK